MPDFKPHPNSLAMKSAQSMTDALALQAMITEMEKRPDKRATEDEKLRLRAIVNRMPAAMREQCRPVCARLGIQL